MNYTNYDLPYLTDKDKSGFDSHKIDLVPRYMPIKDISNRTQYSSEEPTTKEVSDKTDLNVTLPKLQKEVEGKENTPCTPTKPVPAPSEEESDNESFGSDTEYNEGVPTNGKENDSPIKKWLSHNRNFDIKINLVVSSGEKGKAQITDSAPMAKLL